tara:strand:+ start:700 stop:1404 length:705 start_codon:yes stop_codon:yes gene_type:complete
MTRVTLTKQTFNTLKNFATINKSIVINPGSKIRTISVNKNIFASTEVKEEFPAQMAIYDLGIFLSGLSLFETPILDFEVDGKVVIRDERSKSYTNYFFSDPDLVVQPPQKDLEPPDEVRCRFYLDAGQLDSLLRAANVYQVPDLCLYSRHGKLILRVCDKKNDTSNTFEVPVGECDLNTDMCVCFKVENLRVQAERYVVTIYGSRVAEFTAVDEDGVIAKSNLKYFIALEPDSQ